MSPYSLLNMLLNSFIARFALDQVPAEEETRPLLLFHHPFRVFRVLLFLWQVDDGDIGTLSRHENGN